MKYLDYIPAGAVVDRWIETHYLDGVPYAYLQLSTGDTVAVRAHVKGNQVWILDEPEVAADATVTIGVATIAELQPDSPGETQHVTMRASTIAGWKVWGEEQPTDEDFKAKRKIRVRYYSKQPPYLPEEEVRRLSWEGGWMPRQVLQVCDPYKWPLLLPLGDADKWKFEDEVEG